MSHRHHNSTTPPSTPSSPSSSPSSTDANSQPEPNSVSDFEEICNKLGFESLDPAVLDYFLGITMLGVDTDTMEVTVELVKRSKVYQHMLVVINKQAKGDVELEKASFFVLAMLTGASCMLHAVDEGYVVDTMSDDGGEE